MEEKCKYCEFPVSQNFYFCPNCGKKIKDKPLSTTLTSQLGLYALSFFLPPLGLWPGIKYLFQSSTKSKIIGVIAITLTIVSLVITINLTLSFFNNPSGANSKQMQELQNLGY